MSKSVFVSLLGTWVGDALTRGHDRSFDVHRRVRVPGAGLVDLVTVRRIADRFSIGLWSMSTGEAGDAGVDAMTRRIHAFEAWYSELVERAELQGFRPAHRVFVSGNIVARAIRRSPLVDLLSTRSSSITFWTWARTSAGFDVAPFYGRTPALGSARTQLRDLLPQLPWEDGAAADRAPSARAIPT